MSEPKDFLWLQVRDLPYFRALLRAVESRFYQDFQLQAPILDLGCGDGHFASITFDRKIDVGLDPWAGPLKQAAARGKYLLTVQSSGDKMPFEDASFQTVISNSVLEHIPDLDAVLLETARVLKPGGMFIFCVPNHQFLTNLSISGFFDRIGLRFLGNAYRGFFNKISRHYHCDSPEVWQPRLKAAGFSVERYWHYFSPHALHVLEWGHYFGLPSVVAKWLFKRWILVPTKWNLSGALAITRPSYDEVPENPSGAYTFYVCRKNSSS
jgi:SAM-dependent methyltransferase